MDRHCGTDSRSLSCGLAADLSGRTCSAPQALPETAGGTPSPHGAPCKISEGGSIMRMRTALLASVCLTFVLTANAAPSLAEGAAALAGQVTSNEDGPMEGVLVTGKKAGSSIAITVVTNKEGRYSFPAARLEPGQYAIKIRAVGYDLD